MRKQIKAWFNQESFYKKFIKMTGKGDKLYADPVKVMCLKLDKEIRKVTPSGEIVIAHSVLYYDLEDITALSTQDVVLIDGIQYVVTQSQKYIDRKQRNKLLEVYVCHG